MCDKRVSIDSHSRRVHSPLSLCSLRHVSSTTEWHSCSLLNGQLPGVDPVNTIRYLVEIPQSVIEQLQGVVAKDRLIDGQLDQLTFQAVGLGVLQLKRHFRIVVSQAREIAELNTGTGMQQPVMASGANRLIEQHLIHLDGGKR